MIRVKTENWKSSETSEDKEINNICSDVLVNIFNNMQHLIPVPGLSSRRVKDWRDIQQKMEETGLILVIDYIMNSMYNSVDIPSDIRVSA